MSNHDFIPFAKPNFSTEEENAVLGVLRSGWLTTGEQTLAFEKEFAQYCGTKHAISLNSATAGLHLALEALGIGPGDQVIIPSYTFAATAAVVCWLAARPLFADIESGTWNLDPSAVEVLLQKHTSVKAVICVHIAGESCNMNALKKLCDSYSIPLVEDCAHAFPVRYEGKFLGTWGKAGVFSFYATKTITTGEGGMLVTDDDALASRAKLMRLHGMDRATWNRYTTGSSWRYQILEPGFKYNMTDIAASIGRVQLKKAESFKKQRIVIASKYNEAFAAMPWVKTPGSNSDHAWHLYILRLRKDKLSIDRDAFIDALSARGIGTSVHFIPLHSMPYYAQKKYDTTALQNTEQRFQESLSLPIYPGLSDLDIERVIGAVRELGEMYGN